MSDTAENAGWAMLRRMGWREGFGVGAREWRGGKSGGAAGGAKAKKVYGCARGPAEAERMASASKAEDELTSADAGGALFAPRPTEEVEIVPKSDRFGLGYDPLRGAPELRGGGGKERRKAFGGVGSVGFDDGDDEDAYGGTADMSQYDTRLDDEEDGGRAAGAAAGVASSTATGSTSGL